MDAHIANGYMDYTTVIYKIYDKKTGKFLKLDEKDRTVSWDDAGTIFNYYGDAESVRLSMILVNGHHEKIIIMEYDITLSPACLRNSFNEGV